MSSQPSSDLDQVRTYFRNFGLKQAPENGSPLYHVLSVGVLNDPDMLRFAASCPPSQPSANLLFGAVHYLLLGGVRHPVRDFYPDVVASEKAPRPPSQDTYPLFQDFVWYHTETIRQLITTRLTPNQRRPPHDLSPADLCSACTRGRESAPLDYRGRQQRRTEPALGSLLPSL